MIFSFWILQNVQPGLGFEILAMVDRAFRIVSEQIYTSFQNIMCPFDDCCSDYWIPADIKSNFNFKFSLTEVIVSYIFLK